MCWIYHYTYCSLKHFGLDEDLPNYYLVTNPRQGERLICSLTPKEVDLLIQLLPEAFLMQGKLSLSKIRRHNYVFYGKVIKETGNPDDSEYEKVLLQGRVDSRTPHVAVVVEHYNQGAEAVKFKSEKGILTQSCWSMMANHRLQDKRLFRKEVGPLAEP